MAITCYINGKVAYPAIKSAIKLTKENPFLHDKDSKTMDVEFPMDIPENRLVFGPVHRIDTSKKLEPFSDCRLLVGNVPVICGSGRVTEISQDNVKLQILSGNTNVRFRAGFDSIFIDRIQYMDVDSMYAKNPSPEGGNPDDLVMVTNQVNTQKFVGVRGSYVFMPVVDSTNDCIANDIALASHIDGYPSDALALFCRAVQPNLMMVLHRVLEHMGYTVKENAYDVSPWNELYICSARQTVIISNMLPHWSVTKFLDEFRKLFNATFIFDDSSKTVRIVNTNALAEAEVITVEPVDELTSTYDEDGIEHLGSSNIKYNLSGLGTETEAIPEEVFKEFNIREFNSHSDLYNAWSAASKKEKLTTLWVDREGYGCSFEVTQEVNGELQLTGDITLRRIGVFSPLVRDSRSDTYLELNMCPVAMDCANHKVRDLKKIMWASNVRYQSDVYEVFSVLPIIENEEGNAYADSEERDYVSIQDVIEAGESATSESEEESVTMQLMWLDERAVHPYPTGDGLYGLQIPMALTDPVIDGLRQLSFALSHAEDRVHIGQLHGNMLRINAGSSVDGNNEVCVKFLYDGIPDVNKIFSFYGKRYLCSKADIDITEQGIDELKTGYFYELLE